MWLSLSKGNVRTEYYHAQTEMRPEKLQASPKTTIPQGPQGTLKVNPALSSTALAPTDREPAEAKQWRQ